jgi:hypothetical protein
MSLPAGWLFMTGVLSIKNIVDLRRLQYIITRKQHFSFLAAKSLLNIATGLTVHIFSVVSARSVLVKNNDTISTYQLWGQILPIYPHHLCDTALSPAILARNLHLKPNSWTYSFVKGAQAWDIRDWVIHTERSYLDRWPVTWGLNQKIQFV